MGRKRADPLRLSAGGTSALSAATRNRSAPNPCAALLEAAAAAHADVRPPGPAPPAPPAPGAIAEELVARERSARGKGARRTMISLRGKLSRAASALLLRAHPPRAHVGREADLRAVTVAVGRGA